MSGSWAGSNRRATLPRNWPAIRERILRRDGHRCQWRMAVGGKCGAHANQVDHIRDPHDHSDANLRALCQAHHDRKSSAEGNAAQRSIRSARAPRTRRPEPHPGLTRK